MREHTHPPFPAVQSPAPASSVFTASTLLLPTLPPSRSLEVSDIGLLIIGVLALGLMHRRSVGWCRQCLVIGAALACLYAAVSLG